MTDQSEKKETVEKRNDSLYPIPPFASSMGFFVMVFAGKRKCNG